MAARKGRPRGARQATTTRAKRTHCPHQRTTRPTTRIFVQEGHIGLASATFPHPPPHRPRLWEAPRGCARPAKPCEALRGRAMPHEELRQAPPRPCEAPRGFAQRHETCDSPRGPARTEGSNPSGIASNGSNFYPSDHSGKPTSARPCEDLRGPARTCEAPRHPPPPKLREAKRSLARPSEASRGEARLRMPAWDVACLEGSGHRRDVPIGTAAHPHNIRGTTSGGRTTASTVSLDATPASCMTALAMVPKQEPTPRRRFFSSALGPRMRAIGVDGGTLLHYHARVGPSNGKGPAAARRRKRRKQADCAQEAV